LVTAEPPLIAAPDGEAAEPDGVAPPAGPAEVFPLPFAEFVPVPPASFEAAGVPAVRPLLAAVVLRTAASCPLLSRAPHADEASATTETAIRTWRARTYSPPSLLPSRPARAR
jgi:hypothetical protein